MVSLLIGLFTFRKQWTLSEMLYQIDKILKRDFKVITPKKITRTIIITTICMLGAAVLALQIMAYIVFQYLKIFSPILCITFFLNNMPYAAIILQFCASSSAIRKRFFYINNVFRQLAGNDIPKVFDLCSRNEKNERLTPTISVQEIYSIYGGYHVRKNFSSKGYNAKEAVNREIKKLTSQLEKQEEGIIEQYKRKDLIEVEEFRITRICNIEMTLEYLTKLVDLHDNLLDCISLQNQIISIQILMIVAQIFVFNVITLFSLYRIIYSTESSIFASMNIFWILLYNIILVIIMMFATECVNEGKFTGTAVHKVINKLSSNYNNVDSRVIEKVKKKSSRN
jgi:7tm Chemosensory receptor